MLTMLKVKTLTYIWPRVHFKWNVNISGTLIIVFLNSSLYLQMAPQHLGSLVLHRCFSRTIRLLIYSATFDHQSFLCFTVVSCINTLRVWFLMHHLWSVSTWANNHPCCLSSWASASFVGVCGVTYNNLLCVKARAMCTAARWRITHFP